MLCSRCSLPVAAGSRGCQCLPSFVPFPPGWRGGSAARRRWRLAVAAWVRAGDSSVPFPKCPVESCHGSVKQLPLF